VAPAFQAANLQFTILRDGEEAIGHRHIGNLSRRKKYEIAVDGLEREREASFVLTRLGQVLEVLVRCPFFPNV